MKPRWLYVLFSCLLLAGSAAGWQWTSYTDISRYGNVIFDGDIMWAATQGGLVKRDLAADTMRIYTTLDGLPDNALAYLSKDSLGNIWFTSSIAALTRFDGSSYTVYPTYLPDYGISNPLPQGFGAGNLLWCVVPWDIDCRVITFDGTQWTVYDSTQGTAPGQSAWYVYFKENGDPVIISDYNDPFTGTNKSILSVGISEKIPGGFSASTTTRPTQIIYSDGITSIYTDPDQGVWVGSKGALSRKKDAVWQTFCTGTRGPENVNVICRTCDTLLWVGTDDGLYAYNGTWTEYDGDYSGVRAIARDGNGTLWAGTETRTVRLLDGSRIRVGGLMKFNGTSFDSVSLLQGVSIYDMVTDRDGHVWLATAAGAGRLDNGSLTMFTTADGLASNTLYSVAVDSTEGIWFGTRSGLNRYIPGTGTWDTFTQTDGLVSLKVTEVAIHPTGAVWCGTGGGISVYDQGVWSEHLTSAAEQSMSGDITALSFMDNGTVWAGGTKGLYRHDTAWHLEFSAAIIPQTKPRIRNAVQDSAGHYWISTSIGPVRFDGTVWTWFDTAGGLPDNDIYQVFVDRNSRLWCATNTGGVYRHDNGVWTVFDTVDGLADNRAYWINQDPSGDIWVGHADCLSNLKGDTWTRVETRPGSGLQYPRVSSLAQDRDGHIWMGYFGAAEFTGSAWYSYIDELPYWRVDDITVDNDNTVWAGTEAGLAAWGGSAWSTIDTSNGLPAQRVQQLTVDSSGNVWAGLWKYHGTPNAFYLTKQSGTAWESTPTVLEHDIMAINTMVTAPDHSIYFGLRLDFDGISKDALVRYANLTWTITDTVYYTGQPLIPDNSGRLWYGNDGYRDSGTWIASDRPDGYQNAAAGACDHNGIMWFATGNGVVAYDGTQWMHYTAAEGLVDNSVYDVMVDHENRKWFATATGVSALEADQLGIADYLQPSEMNRDICLTALPNPFTGSTTLHHTGSSPIVSVTIMDRTGKQIVSLTGQTGRVRWDGRDRSGKTVPAGIYYGIIPDGKQQPVVKIIKTD